MRVLVVAEVTESSRIKHVTDSCGLVTSYRCGVGVFDNASVLRPVQDWF
ncbi:hypothetical protein NOR51B_1844 [Luminiphilus syltensis NOR5-1B]|uniref:Uncharacterized protein n=1 Tax=Luminiphilus syltensis NOR5-1B TaxID=565045 RepID=B8KU20_9GAMM|nr:hypothetical protein NOR51B_1844 [Luminiphilus syltensis NOR5-1B]